ncbi:MAG: 30S ribosome-binding factor RbfA [Thiomargarita sp.]|nr:30S ribosome-binding factor RbfA [Thiomargarita sp.]
MKEFKRSQRVNVLIQRELSDIIRKEITASHLGMLTISSVDIAPDFKSARIYITVLGGTVDMITVMKYLNDASGQLRYHLSQRLSTRTTPRLQFIHDSSVEYGSRLSALIDSVLPHG